MPLHGVDLQRDQQRCLDEEKRQLLWRKQCSEREHLAHHPHNCHLNRCNCGPCYWHMYLPTEAGLQTSPGGWTIING
ncbi:Putative LOC101883013 [Caligus rogercresseyi]|uniref:LOC101883013 n=1 Tax=Caligus rogercresseyi TaxID=217165 RepID=A0A7T8QRW4_CALRO|nr:Putative LOC101883013 [Caligus rogercresseyi]